MVASSIIINLGNSKEEKLEIEDFGTVFNYTRLKDPDGKKTHLWNLFCRKIPPTEEEIKNGAKAEPWKPIPGMLSDEYSIVRTKDCVDSIQGQLGGKIVGQRHYRDSASINCQFMLEGYEINDIKETDLVNKVLFGIITGIDEDIIDQRSMLSFNIINSMCGSRKLVLNYGFMSSIYTPSNRRLSINNLYLLDEFRSDMIHDRKISISYAQVEDVKKFLGEKIQQFKDIPVTQDFMDSFCDNFIRRITKKVKAIYKELPENLQNFYYLTYIISSVAARVKMIEFEVRSRKFISQYINRQLKKQNNKVFSLAK